MKSIRNNPTIMQRGSRRSGVAAVECALVAPLLVLVVLSAIDVGQFINVSQVVDNGAREGVRKAIRDTSAVTGALREVGAILDLHPSAPSLTGSVDEAEFLERRIALAFNFGAKSVELRRPGP